MEDFLVLIDDCEQRSTATQQLMQSSACTEEQTQGQSLTVPTGLPFPTKNVHSEMSQKPKYALKILKMQTALHLKGSTISGCSFTTVQTPDSGSCKDSENTLANSEFRYNSQLYTRLKRDNGHSGNLCDVNLTHPPTKLQPPNGLANRSFEISLTTLTPLLMLKVPSTIGLKLSKGRENQQILPDEPCGTGRIENKHQPQSQHNPRSAGVSKFDEVFDCHNSSTKPIL